MAKDYIASNDDACFYVPRRTERAEAGEQSPSKGGEWGTRRAAAGMTRAAEEDAWPKEKRTGQSYRAERLSVRPSVRPSLVRSFHSSSLLLCCCCCCLALYFASCYVPFCDKRPLGTIRPLSISCATSLASFQFCACHGWPRGRCFLYLFALYGGSGGGRSRASKDLSEDCFDACTSAY